MTVLFLCRQNAGRSQMAQAFLERVAPEHAAVSAGSNTAAAVHPTGCDDPAVCDYPGRRVEDWGIPDPSGKAIDDARRIRDLLRARVEALAQRLRSTSAEKARST